MQLLESPRWQPHNRDLLNRWLSSPQPMRPFVPCAVFDFDNTCIFGDIGDQTFHHQLDLLQIRMTPHELDTHLGVMNDARCAELKQIVLRNYAHAVMGSPAHHTFRAAMALLCKRLSHLDRPRALLTLAGLLAGFTEEEAEALAIDAYIHASQHPLMQHAWQCPHENLEYPFARSVRAQPEMEELILALDHAGIPPTVVSASCEYLVRGVARHLGLCIKPSRIFGIRLQHNTDQTLQNMPLDESDYPLTYREGKTRLIQNHISEKPVLVAGDADNDVPMLTQFKETEVRLIIHRNLYSHEIGALYEHAAKVGSPEIGPGHTLTLVQGRNEHLGAFHSEHTTIDGKSLAGSD